MPRRCASHARPPSMPHSMHTRSASRARTRDRPHSRRGLDQPTTTGINHPQKDAALHSKFMKPGVAKPLTRSAEPFDMSANWRAGRRKHGPPKQRRWVAQFSASSEEFVGEFRLGELAEHVIQREFGDAEGPIAIRFSHGDFG